ncbi:helix-turn-helix domain-containing protein [Streptomyces sp. NPDC056486]|uniref:helix-turn-helix domain-containing protein n=1 Tax=Streptomyces sp. NPDC056486 TaxID=3345835 RepID=UPI00369FF884
MRGSPTGRQLRLGSELRKLRERAGLSSTEAAQSLGIKQNQVSNIEAGRHGVSPERVRTMACRYDCSNEALVDALAEIANGRARGWWEEYRELLPDGMLDLAEVEHHSVRLRAGITAHIPGLLQIHDHAREVFRQVVPELSPPEVEHRLSFRIKRQAVLFGEPPVPYQAIIHEAALHMQFGGPSVTARQLQHVLDMSERDHIQVGVIPFTAGAYPGSGQSILYAEGPVPQLDTVHLDQSHGAALICAEAQLGKYRMLLARIEDKALSPSASRDLILSIVHNL